MGEIKLPEDLLTEEEKKQLRKTIEETRGTMGGIPSHRSGCMLILILPLILSLTMIFLISF